MRFHQLPVGENFTFQGERYTKRNDLMAVHAETGKQQLVKRSAEVEPVSGPGTEAGKPALQGNLPADAVLEAFDAFYLDCAQLLADTTPRRSQRARIESRLRHARQAFLNKLAE